MTTAPRRRGWSRDQYDTWVWVFGADGAGMALIWLGTDWWFFGLCAVICLVFAGWSWIERDRVD